MPVTHDTFWSLIPIRWLLRSLRHRIGIQLVKFFANKNTTAIESVLLCPKLMDMGLWKTNFFSHFKGVSRRFIESANIRMPPLPQNLLLHLFVNIQFLLYMPHNWNLHRIIVVLCFLGPLRGRVNFQSENLLFAIPARHPDILYLLLRMVRAFL